MYKPKLQKHAKSCSYIYVHVHCTDAHVYIHVHTACTYMYIYKNAKLASYTKHTACYAHVVEVYACDYAVGINCSKWCSQ